MNIVHHGVTKTGYPIEETTRRFIGARAFVERRELVETSGAPLDPALFTVPDGYRPALPRPTGGFDLSKPDTVWNRIEAYRDYSVMWVNSWVRYWLYGPTGPGY